MADHTDLDLDLDIISTIGNRDYPSTVEDFEREEREAGRKYDAAYRSILGEAPACLPADHERAKRYLDRIEHAISTGGWTKSERNRLYSMQKKWKKRSEGRDSWFETYGTRLLNKASEAESRKQSEDSRRIRKARLNALNTVTEIDAMSMDNDKDEDKDIG